MNPVQGVVSLLDSEHTKRVEDLWAELEEKLGLANTCPTPFPHFTYQVAASYQVDALEPALQHFAGRKAEFRVKTAGLGVFTGARPVLYIPVVRSPELTEFHRELWQAIDGAGSGLSSYYHPDRWVPHITLALIDILPDKLAAMVRLLGERELDWEFTVDNLCFIYDDGTLPRLKCRCGFGEDRQVQP